ncbi:MAG: exodeoxyribonuclease VII large subunit, partial [Actinobacteria bacterium]|nr:exodeoxyribonuclease VII large subunit [Actinomycetota bacterium]
GGVNFYLAARGRRGAAPRAQFPVVLFPDDRARVNDRLRSAGAGRMEDGVELRIRARFGWFAARGRLQLRMVDVDAAHTLGRLAADRSRLLAALRAEGLLDANRRLPLPVLPRRVGLVTSVGSAAYHDFVDELDRSGLGFTLVVADARTSGEGVARSVTAALGALASAGVDLVAIVRGGGSRSDLAPFDGEALVRAVAGCPVPVITGVGHEIDRSVADEVAHACAKTPTACAALIVERAQAARDRADRCATELPKAAGRALARIAAELDGHGARLARGAGGGVRSATASLERAGDRLRRESIRAAGRSAHRLASAEVRLRALDPAVALARGWSVTHTSTGRLVRAPGDAPAGTDLLTTLAGGTLASRVAVDGSDAEAP